MTKNLMSHPPSLLGSVPLFAPDNKLVIDRGKRTYQFCQKLGEGAFGSVYCALNGNGKKVAIKIVKIDRRLKNRELSILKICESPYIMKLKDYCIEDDTLYLVTDVMPTSLGRYLRHSHASSCPISNEEIRLYAYQIFSGLQYLHERGIAHRDIKPDNLLIDPVTCRLKICDLGSAKELTHDPISVSYIASRNYRAPELLLNCRTYGFSIDIWAAGCVIAEMLLDDIPMFQGSDNSDLLVSIMRILGKPTTDDSQSFDHPLDFPGDVEQIASVELALPLSTDPDLLDLLKSIFVYNPNKRPTAAECLDSRYFANTRI